MRRWTRHLPRAALVTALAALAAGACTDRTPTGARPDPQGPTGPGAEPVTLQALHCQGNRRTLRVAFCLSLFGRQEQEATAVCERHGVRPSPPAEDRHDALDRTGLR